MGIRDELNRLRASLKGHLTAFELRNGGRYWFDTAEAYEELFLFGVACLRAGRVEDRPDPPEIVRALAKAKDRRAAFDALGPLPFWPYEYEAFVERGDLVPRSMIAAGDATEPPAADMSEPAS